MAEFIFTFGSDQLHEGQCQPIFACNMMKARTKMFEIYGDKWSFGYTREEWETLRDNPTRTWTMEREMIAIQGDNKW